MVLSGSVLAALYTTAAAVIGGGIGTEVCRRILDNDATGDQTDEDLCAHRYVRGATGSGKSTFLANLFARSCRAGHGAWWVSTHGGANMLDLVPPERAGDVVFLAPASDRPLGFNLFRRYTSEAIEDSLVADQATNLVKMLYSDSWGSRIEELVSTAALALLSWARETGEEPTIVELYRVLADEGFRRGVLATARQLGVADAFDQKDRGAKEALQRAAAKVRRAVTNPVILATLGQRDGLDLADLVRRRAVVVTDLDAGRLGRLTAGFLAQVVVGKLQIIAMGRPPEAPLVELYLDEFQTYVLDGIELLLTEGRKKRMAVTLAHQEAAQLPKSLLAATLQVGSKYLFRQTPPDATLAAADFPKGRFDRDYFASLPNYVCVAKEVVRGRMRTRVLHAPPPPGPTGAAEAIIARCRGPARDAVLAEIAGRGRRGPGDEVDTSGTVEVAGP